MADLPMAQIPNFQLSAPNPQLGIGNAIQGAQQGGQQAIQAAQFQQQQALAQQKWQMEKQQQTISQVDTLLKSGMNYPGMLPTFWPAIATRMNSLSPDYHLDPNNPPENLKNFATQLSSISDGLQDKVVSPDQAHAATKQLIASSYPTPVPTAGTQGPTGQPVTQAPQGQPQQPPAQGQPSLQTGQQQQPTWDISQFGQNPAADFIHLKPLYDQANQLISQAPMEGPQSQEVLRKQFESSSLGTMYKRTLDNLSQQFGAGQENARFQQSQHTEHVNTQINNFKEDTGVKDNAQSSSDYVNAITNLSNPLLQQDPNSLTPAQSQAVLQTERNAIIKAIQAETPQSHRPINFSAEDQLNKGGSAVSKWKAAWNQVSSNTLLTPDQLAGLRSELVDGHANIDADQTQKENSSVELAKAQGVQPQEFLQNKRASPNIVSTSQYFPTKTGSGRPLIGEVRKLVLSQKGNQQGSFKFLGGDPSNYGGSSPTNYGNYIPVNEQ